MQSAVIAIVAVVCLAAGFGAGRVSAPKFSGDEIAAEEAESALGAVGVTREYNRDNPCIQSRVDSMAIARAEEAMSIWKMLGVRGAARFEAVNARRIRLDRANMELYGQCSEGGRH